MKGVSEERDRMPRYYMQVTTDGMADVVRERHRQQDREGFSEVHDDSYQHNELIRAAVSYCHTARTEPEEAGRWWPWDWKWFKPTNRRRDLVKAAALLIAEIERIDREAGSAPGK